MFKIWLESETVPCGECYQYAYQLYKRLVESGESVALVHGTVIDPWDNKKINHAWVSWQGNVYDWQSGGKRSSRKEFMKVMKAKADNVYQPDDLVKVMTLLAKNNHYGPWVV